MIGGTSFLTAASTSLGIKAGTELDKNLSINTILKESKNSNLDNNSIPSPTDDFSHSPLEPGDLSHLENLLTDLFLLNILLLILFLIFVFLIFYRYFYSVNFEFYSSLINRIIPDRFKSRSNSILKTSANFNNRFILFIFICNIFNLIIILSISLYISFELSTNINDYVTVYNYLHVYPNFNLHSMFNNISNNDDKKELIPFFLKFVSLKNKDNNNSDKNNKSPFFKWFKFLLLILSLVLILLIISNKIWFITILKLFSFMFHLINENRFLIKCVLSLMVYLYILLYLFILFKFLFFFEK